MCKKDQFVKSDEGATGMGLGFLQLADTMVPKQITFSKNP